MDVYRKQTQKTLKRFLGREITFPECIAALDHALAGRIQTLLPEELLNLRAVILANNETVMKEMAKREKQRKAQAKSRPKNPDAQMDPLPKYGLVYQLSSEVKAIALNFGNDISKRNGSDKWEVPVPGTFVIDTKGVVRFAQVDPNFMTGRANPEAVLDILTKLSPHRKGK